MEDFKNNLIKFENNLINYKMLRYDEIPDIDLYMDQTILFLNKYLSILSKSTEECVITSSMINNYVKCGIVPAPIKKKYSRRHLAYIITVCFLKQILSMNEISTIINYLLATRSERDSYAYFCEVMETSLKNCCKIVNVDKKNDDTTDMANFSLFFATKALANKIYAEKCVLLQQLYLENKKSIKGEVKK